MNYCEYCRREFKTVQGLLGHQRMVHDRGDVGNENNHDEQRIEVVLARIEESVMLLECLAVAAVLGSSGRLNSKEGAQILKETRQRYLLASNRVSL